ncbi:MAG TPA: polysaccharide biosynthesis tyrosine autokinase, partial [Myxococcota bacterium]
MTPKAVPLDPERHNNDHHHEDHWEPPVVINAAERPIDWGRYLDAVQRRIWLVAGVVVVCIVGAAIFTVRQPKLFQAACSIVIETSTPRVLTGVENVMDVGAGGWVPESFYETEYEIMQSRAVARAAGEKIGITHDGKRNGLGDKPDGPDKEQAEAALDAADLVMGRYSVDPDKKSSVVRIAVVDADPAFTAGLSNAVAEAYLEQNLEKRISGTRDAGTWLSVQHTDLKKKLEASEDLLYKFMEDNDVLNASLESQLEEVKQRLTAFNAALANTQADGIRDQLDAKALADVKANPALIDTLKEIQNAGVINQLKGKLVELRALRVEMSARYQDDHPKMKTLNEQISTLEKDLQKEIDSVLASMDRSEASRINTETGLKKALTEEREREAHLNKLSLEYSRLKREVDTNAKLYDMVTSRMKEADITSALPFNNVRILDRALVPAAPFKPNLRNNLLIGLVLGILLGLGLAILLDLIDNTLKSQEDIEGTLEVPFLGLLPLIEAGTRRSKDRAVALASTKERDLYVMHNPKSPAAECARFIRTNLLFMSPDRPLKTIVVTSPGPAEGKTTTAVSLAIAMAQSGNRTLIVDTDMRRPRLHRVFDIDSEVGLSTVIVGECKLENAVRKTEVPGLEVLVCGPPPPNPQELLHAERFSQLLLDLAARYDRVIFDAPPVGPVADP